MKVHRGDGDGDGDDFNQPEIGERDLPCNEQESSFNYSFLRFHPSSETQLSGVSLSSNQANNFVVLALTE